MSGWDNQSDDTKRMFESVFGGDAQKAWEWEDSHPGQGSYSGGGGSSQDGNPDATLKQSISDYTDQVNSYNKWAQQGNWAEADKARKQAAQIAANNLKLQKQQLEKDWFTARANAKSDQQRNAIDAKYKSDLTSLGWDEHNRLWQQLGLDRAKFGGDLVKQAADYASAPSKYWMSQDLNAGIQQLMGNGGGAFGGGQVDGGGQVNALGALAAQLGLSGLLQQGLTGSDGNGMVGANAGGVPGAGASPMPSSTPAGASGPIATTMGGPSGSGSWVGANAGAPAGGANTMGDAGATGAKPAPDMGQSAIQAIVKNWTPSNTDGWNPDDVRALSTIAAIAKQGAQKLAPGSLEGMDPDARDMFLAAIPRAGLGSSRSFQSAYNLSRPSQGSATSY